MILNSIEPGEGRPQPGRIGSRSHYWAVARMMTENWTGWPRWRARTRHELRSDVADRPADVGDIDKGCEMLLELARPLAA